MLYNQDNWMQEVMDLASNDPWHNKCLQEFRDLGPSFLEVSEKLSPKEREIVDAYIVACDELTYSLVQAAYTVGRRHGRRPTD